MTFLALLIGITVPALLGWLAIACVEGRSPVLGRLERLAWSLSLGVTLMMFAALIAHWTGLTRLNLAGFAIPAALLALALGICGWRNGGLRAAWSYRPEPHPSAPVPRVAKIALGMLLLWTCIKLIAGTYDLVSVPTYWDDSFNNWNMRGKMFFVLERLELTIPVGNGVVQAETGVSSYPPTVPLMKTWLSAVRGSWQEPLVNGVHMIWFLGLLASTYFFLRRFASMPVAWIGTYALASLPLMLIHGANPYADMFVSAHVLAAAACVFFAGRCDGGARRTWVRLGGLVIGLLVFTKNESMLLYAPVLAALLAWTVLRASSGKELGERRNLIAAALAASAIVLPWLLFKWTHGLSFGNAKAVSSLGISFSPTAVQAIWFHLSHEPNWLLLPMLLPLLVALNGRRGWNVLTVFLGVVLAEQFCIYAFTSLANEAILQTGLSRGLLHIAPVAVVLCVLLIERLRTTDA